jgi:protein-glucosylgalactosylhydroxylysine glucosidase
MMNFFRKIIGSLVLSLCALLASAQKIDRKQLVQRHNIIVNKVDSLSSLSVGNGSFAFTVDITGLQSFPETFKKGISLGTQSEWGWHSFIDTSDFKRSEAIKTYHLNGRNITYTVQWNSPERNKAAGNWFRQNPHRLQLGTLGFDLFKKNGELATVNDIENIKQELDLWTGQVKSHFTLEGIPVDVVTYCHGQYDFIGAKVESALIIEGRLKIKLRFPYPTGEWTDEGANWKNADRHQSFIVTNRPGNLAIQHQLDLDKYFVHMVWSGNAKVDEKEAHYFTITPGADKNQFAFSTRFTPVQPTSVLIPFEAVRQNSEITWQQFWNSGAAIDFKGSTDPRAFELERRIILSQYQLRVQEAGYFPPQETGLTYNSWFGKPHLEMHWWHTAQYALWGRLDLLEKSMSWYKKVASKAKAIAKRQGFEGVRWQKMTDNQGEEAPSSIGAFLIWQQPHYIYFAELCYREKKNAALLNKYKDLVFATADFMASFPYYDKSKGKYILGKGLIPAQERFKAEETYNPAYELVYWHWALEVAQQWRMRLKMPRNAKWDEVVKKLSPLAVQDGLYLATESATDSYTNPEFRTDHPSVLGALGMMPPTGQVDQKIMQSTFDWVWKNWTWAETWGWDFAMTAMTATRLGLPDKAIDALLMNIQTNTYLINGHNYQDGRLRLYLPGNGGLLMAIAMMCAGYDGSTIPNPGIPRNGKWKVKWEGLRKMP